jgi:hypothetical protein
VTALVAPGPEVTSTTPGLPVDAGIAFGHVHRALFVAHQNVPDVVLLKYLVIDRQHCAAGIAKDHLDTLILQGLNHHPRTGHRGAPSCVAGHYECCTAASTVISVNLMSHGGLFLYLYYVSGP